MKRLPLLCAAVLVLALVAFVVGAYAQATGELRTFMPLIAQLAQAEDSVCDGQNPIQTTDTGALFVVRQPDGSYDVAYQNRQEGGGRAHVAKHAGDHLEEIDSPALAQALGALPTLAPSPSFSPDGPKQGALVLVPAAEPGGLSRFYFTQREPDDTPNEGPYVIYCVSYVSAT